MIRIDPPEPGGDIYACAAACRCGMVSRVNVPLLPGEPETAILPVFVAGLEFVGWQFRPDAGGATASYCPDCARRAAP